MKKKNEKFSFIHNHSLSPKYYWYTLYQMKIAYNDKS